MTTMTRSVDPLHSSLLDDRWAVFRSVHTYPASFVDVFRDSGLSHVRCVNALVALERDDLIVLHSSRPLEWRLNDANL